MVDIVRNKIAEIHVLSGFNVGFNEVLAVGQTVDHLHIHVIPKFVGGTSAVVLLVASDFEV